MSQENDIHDTMLETLEEFTSRSKSREHHPEQVRIACVLLSVLGIFLLTARGMLLWAAPMPLFPDLGKAVASAVIGMIERE